MDRQAADPLTLSEAKARLLQAAGRMGLESWTREHPLEGVSFAFLLGLVTGASPDARGVVRDVLLLLTRRL